MAYNPPNTQFEIIRHQPDTEKYDIMGGTECLEIKIGEHGSVALMDIMPRLVPKGQTCDYAITQAARTSFGKSGIKTPAEDRGLVRYLLRMKHSTPLEMVEFKFRHVLPVFVARQLIRHRTANVSEFSGRYAVIKDRFFRPGIDSIRKQSNTNKQGGTEPVDLGTAEEFLKWLDEQEQNYKTYQGFVERGIAREQARIGLPLTMFTEWYWKIDLHNLLHFLSLRLDSHAQQEIQDYAFPMLELIRPFVPNAVEAFFDYHPNMDAMLLTGPEIKAINGGELPDNKRELQEFKAKLLRMGGFMSLIEQIDEVILQS